MCGAALDLKPRRTFAIPWADVVLFLVIVGVVAAWWSRPALPEPEEAALAPVSTLSPSPTPTETLPSTPTPTQTATPLPTPTPTPVVYVVKRGDIPERIANEYGITVEALLDANGLTAKSIIYEGQKLRIPLTGPVGGPDVSRPTSAPTRESGIYIYRVQPGDTLLAIAAQFSTTLSAILSSNNLREDAIIQPGQVLTVPVGSPATPTPLPAPTRVIVMSAPVKRGWPAPVLLGPAEGARYDGEGPILLRWASVGVLAEDEWYVVRLWSAGDAGASSITAWTKATSWHVPSELRPPSSATDRRLYWQVTVMRSLGAESDGSHEGEAVSPRSEVRSFLWH